MFGPVLTLQPFADEDEAIALANDTDYGLAAILYTGDRERAERVSRAAGRRHRLGELLLRARPARAVRRVAKTPGVGREGGVWSFDFYADVKNVCTGTRGTKGADDDG